MKIAPQTGKSGTISLSPDGHIEFSGWEFEIEEKDGYVDEAARRFVVPYANTCAAILEHLLERVRNAPDDLIRPLMADYCQITARFDTEGQPK